MTMKVAIVGTVGVPGCYGGFETLAENLVRYHHENKRSEELAVYCSGIHYADRQKQFLEADLRYIPLKANGVQSILYDSWSMIDACLRGYKVVLCLGTSGALMLPFLRLVPGTKVISNVDGMEWGRAKWNISARTLLRFLEFLAVRFSHVVIADNECVLGHVKSKYKRECELIEYGGDHATKAKSGELQDVMLPNSFALGLCRIEPENNVGLILEVFSDADVGNLVFVGNWESSEYGRKLHSKYSKLPNVQLVPPIFDSGVLKGIRENALVYLHGHSAGGTNPSLVEMMHFGIPILAHDNEFNRYTTEGRAIYFNGVDDLRGQLKNLKRIGSGSVGRSMKEIALRRYTWKRIGKLYFDIISAV